jgi:hypothetical protein
MRTWIAHAEDDGSIHAMGNGQLLAYGRGPDLPHLYGPPYSSPNILSLTTEADGPLSDEATRAPRKRHLAAPPAGRRAAGVVLPGVRRRRGASLCAPVQR